MNLGSLNGSALNASALATWVKAALVAASVGCDAAAVATYNYRAASALSAGGAGLAAAAVIRPGAAGLSAGSTATAAATMRWAGRSELAAGSFAVAFVYRPVAGAATAAAGATGEATPNAELGEAALSAGLAGAASGTKTQFTTAALSAGGDGEARAQFGSPALGYGTALGLAEASTQLFGESFYNHDGFVLAEAGAAATVAETHWQRFLTGTVTPAASLSGTAQAYKIHPGNAALSGGVQDATADYRNLVNGEAGATAGGSTLGLVAVRTQYPLSALSAGANARAAARVTWSGRVAASGAITSLTTPTRGQPGAATLSAGMDFVSSQFADQYWAAASGTAGGDGAAAARVVQRADAGGSSGSEAEAVGTQLYQVTSSATLTSAAAAAALTNIEVDAPPCRTWTLVAEDRVLWLSDDNRTMTAGC